MMRIEAADMDQTPPCLSSEPACANFKSQLWMGDRQEN